MVQPLIAPLPPVDKDKQEMTADSMAMAMTPARPARRWFPPKARPDSQEKLYLLSAQKSWWLYLVLQEVANHLLTIPSRSAPLEWLCRVVSKACFKWLRKEKLILNSVLKYHADHFVLYGLGVNTSVKYLHDTADVEFRYAERLFTHVKQIKL
eukprot:TRINITY_DN28175_c0_g1_i3.p1 TRINITY_DN28175_c0_g1~~TRINITY_DN28175_c0_g1_i3.p1  ORF type:complete len:153 (-),score=30.78 TRINITY_DN28175_c0_g1_i3:238-696(-)